MPDSPIAFIGLGNMGAPMVRCLVRKGYSVRAYDVDSEKTAQLARETELCGRVEPAWSLVSAACGACALVTMLPDSDAVRKVVLGTKDQPGVIDELPTGSIIIDMSSSFPLDTQKLGAVLAARGIALVDAPVSGGVLKAVAGTLAIMAGGESEAVARVTPLLSAMGTVLPTGPLGSGHATKALNNYVSAAGLVATCEALVIARRFGLDPVTVNRVFNASTGRNNTTENKSERYLIPKTFNSGFSLALMSKDVGMAKCLADELGLFADQLEFVASLLGRASRVLPNDADHTEIMALVDADSQPEG